MKEIISGGPEETKDVGKRLARKLKPGDCISLIGELGAGKTTLIKGIAKGLGIKEEVVSPTFILIREYKGGLPLYHVDAYRISKEEELREVGIEEYLLSDDGVTVVEWGDRVKKIFPPGGSTSRCTEIRIEILSESKRRIIVR